MKCVVLSHNVKVLAKAFHSLAKIGDDLFIEPHIHHIAFRTVNMAESAYASINFRETFFSSFTFNQDDNEEGLRCKIAMKSLLMVLKMPHGLIERLIEWCQLRIDIDENKVIFQLRYSYGCTKTYFLPIIDNETLQASYSKEDCENRISVLPKLLSTTVKNFRTSEDEVTLCAMPQKLVLRNHLENNLQSKKALKTEIGLFPAEFESYNITSPTSVTFCLKELRAALFFAEYTGLPIQFFIQSPGKPIVFVIYNEGMYDADYVVSTLNESGTPQTLSQSSESSAAVSDKAPAPNQPRKRQRVEFSESITPGNCSQLRPNHLNNSSSASSSHNAPEPFLRQENGYTNGDHMLNRSEVQNASLQCTMNTISSVSDVTQPVVNNVFGRCFNTTFKKHSLPGFNEVLAYDSDGMEDSD